ncbi:unnamed protein product [Linum tenue]|uniref:protein-serine/threonine phosphatase n=1 Tax=Linum tenue TaxID=586396 RepID=A0AAV0H8L2_9ROSI|nr:unnamed protein product [Linum tenue]
MAAGTDFSPPFAMLNGGGYNNSSSNKDISRNLSPAAGADENSDAVKQIPNGRPPRHTIPSARLLAAADLAMDVGIVVNKLPSDEKTDFLPVFRSGSCAEEGPKRYMEDEHVCIDDLNQHLGSTTASFSSMGAFYGVFDGHGGTDAALFVRNNILRYIVDDSQFPMCVEKAIKSAFLRADYTFADDSSLDISSGTTVLTALMLGRGH